MRTERICVVHRQQVFYWLQVEAVNTLVGLWGKKVLNKCFKYIMKKKRGYITLYREVVGFVT